MDIIILIAIYVVELLKYWTFIGGFLNVKLKNRWLGAVGLGIYALLSLNEQTREYDTHFMMYFIVMVVTFWIIEAKAIYRILDVFIALLVTGCADEIFGIFMESFWLQHQGTELLKNIQFLSESVISLIFIVLLILIKKKIKTLKDVDYLSIVKAIMPILMIVLAFLLAVTVGGLNNEKGSFHNERIELIINIISILSFVSICFLVGFMLYITNTNRKMEEMLETERKLKEMQLNYYKDMLDREESTRKYRHDMNNHLICLNELAKEGTTEGVIEYVNAMQEQIITIQQKVYKVGNEILDAILNYHLPLVQDVAKVEVKGYCRQEIHISNVDLCTIFANLIQNAVEELKKENNKERFLRVHIKTGNEFMQVEITNSLSILSKEKTELFTSEKSDKHNHGFGLGNVKQTVEKNGGKFEVKMKDNTFVAIVILKFGMNLE